MTCSVLMGLVLHFVNAKGRASGLQRFSVFFDCKWEAVGRHVWWLIRCGAPGEQVSRGPYAGAVAVWRW